MAPLDRPIRIGTDCSGMETPVMALRALKVEYEHMFSCDIEKSVKEQILANFPPKVWFDDLMARDNDSRSTPSVDLYVAGFPCQSFSAAGLGLGFNDKRGEVFFGCASYIEAKRPRVFVLENVKAILTNDGGDTFKTVMSTLKQIGSGAYHVSHKVLDTQDHGVPQSRKRVYFVGIRKNTVPAGFQGFEWPEELPRVSIEPFLNRRRKVPTMKDLPKKGGVTARSGAKEVLQQLKREGKDPLNKTYIIDIDASARYRNFMRDRCPCMTKSRAAGYWISSRARRMSLEEMLRCQGMEPGCFKQVVSDRAIGAQIGNAMSQNILERLFLKLLPLAGLVPASQALKDRFKSRAMMLPRSKVEEPKTGKRALEKAPKDKVTKKVGLKRRRV
ncbi:unnamed protein product [Effrenium voratum]|uniref:DNA (cytosine-5-)-methyltransferase n=1 Tax=Effrenium voratum TaxID=2562239 RepID=A0AA36J2P4_9DINO|nr:unnamed protein product [Effrenium voratum]CAJ1397404.1 unnamed protein product [Effrenium voratum]